MAGNRFSYLCIILGVSLLLTLVPSLFAAHLQTVEEDQGVTGFGLALRRLPTVASVLVITAHPDDVQRVGEILKEAYTEAPKWFGVECMDGGDPEFGETYAAVH